MLAVFKTRFYPYLFAIAFLGFFAFVCLKQLASKDAYAKSSQYFLFFFMASLIFFVGAVLVSYTSLTIYNDRLILERIFTGTRDEILFDEVESVSTKNLFYRGLNSKFGEATRHEAMLYFLMKDNQKLEIDLSSYPELEKLLTVLKETELWNKHV
ncbi:MAG TPA: hypothetical protein VK154_02845 [Chitinophagales bacterium]|nr:hypothetical protein [Chitinophagales bacterium]